MLTDSINVLAVTEGLGGAFSGERWAYAGQMTLLGLLTVFAVLAILCGVLVIFRLFAYDIPNKRKNKLSDAGKKTAEVASAEPEETLQTGEDADMGETVAVITAAVSAYLASENGGTQVPDGSFRVVSFRRVSGRSSWNSGK